VSPLLLALLMVVTIASVSLAGLLLTRRFLLPRFHYHDGINDAISGTVQTIGVFYAESPSMRQLQRKAGMGDFDHLVIHSSMIRPAANRFIREYVRRLKGGAYEPLHPALENTLDETFGILCYQEDVTKVCMDLAGMSLADAESLRKALSQKRPVKPVRAHAMDFYAGAAERGVARDVIDKIWDMILSFAGYSFCKPHSASYALVSFRSAWLRAHHPAEFIAAVISNQGGYYDTFAYVSEARRMGLAILPPDVNASERAYTGKGREVRVGLMQLKGLHAETLEALVAERARGGAYASWEDLRRRVRLRTSDAELLVKSGACDSIARGRTRPELLWELYLDAGAPGGSAAPRSGPVALDLFTPPSLEPPPAPAHDRESVLRHETETLGFLLSAHPIEPYERAMRGRGVIPARDLELHVGRRVRVLGWHVTSKLIETGKHEPMEFRGFEDTTALFDATLFPEAYRKFCHLLTPDRPFLLTGKVEEEFGVCSLVVERVERL